MAFGKLTKATKAAVPLVLAAALVGMAVYWLFFKKEWFMPSWGEGITGPKARWGQLDGATQLKGYYSSETNQPIPDGTWAITVMGKVTQITGKFTPDKPGYEGEGNPATAGKSPVYTIEYMWGMNEPKKYRFQVNNTPQGITRATKAGIHYWKVGTQVLLQVTAPQASRSDRPAPPVKVFAVESLSSMRPPSPVWAKTWAQMKYFIE
jgi:hypothetical protein